MAEPQLSATWWDKNRAKTLPSTGLTKVLTKYGKTLAQFEAAMQRKTDTWTDVPPLYVQLDKDLDDVEKGLKTASGKCNKTLHKETLANLDKLTRTALPAERRRVAQLHSEWQKYRKARADGLIKARADAGKAMQATSDKIQAQLKAIESLADKLDAAVTTVMTASVRNDRATVDKSLKDAQAHYAAATKALATLQAAAAAAKKTEPPPVPQGFADLVPTASGNEFFDARTTAVYVADQGEDVVEPMKKTIADALAAAKGGFDASMVVQKEFERLIPRMARADLEADKFERSVKSILESFEELLTEYKAAADPGEKDRLKKELIGAGQAFGNDVRLAEGVQQAIVADMTRTLNAQPKGAFNSEAEPFKSLLAKIKEHNNGLLESKRSIAKRTDRFKVVAKEFTSAG